MGPSRIDIQRAIGILLILAAMLLAGMSFSPLAAPTAQETAPISAMLGSRPVVPAQGAPAIPVPHGTPSPSSASMPSGTPPLTAQDVRSYVEAHPGVPRGMLVGTPTIGSISLMTLPQVAAFLEQPSVTLSTSKLYYVVVFDNQAKFPGPGIIVTTRTAFEVFDAYTGNLMASGGQN